MIEIKAAFHDPSFMAPLTSTRNHREAPSKVVCVTVCLGLFVNVGLCQCIEGLPFGGMSVLVFVCLGDCMWL